MFYRLVWMIEEQVTAELVSFGSYSSRVQYTLDGVHYDETVINDDFIMLDDLGIDFEILDNE